MCTRMLATLGLSSPMRRDDLTVHGFRSTFRDWAVELTNFANEMVEMALAHAVGDKVEAAYACRTYRHADMRRNTARIKSSDRVARWLAGNTNSLSRTFAMRSSTAMAAVDNGIRCSRPLFRLVFMRAAGTVHRRVRRSISSHRAPRASPVRAAVRIVNSRARAATPSRRRTSAMNVPTSAYGSAAWCAMRAAALANQPPPPPKRVSRAVEPFGPFRDIRRSHGSRSYLARLR